MITHVSTWLPNSLLGWERWETDMCFFLWFRGADVIPTASRCLWTEFLEWEVLIVCKQPASRNSPALCVVCFTSAHRLHTARTKPKRPMSRWCCSLPEPKSSFANCLGRNKGKKAELLIEFGGCLAQSVQVTATHHFDPLRDGTKGV